LRRRTVAKTIRGTVYGKRIELDEDLGVSDGQKVEVQVTVISPTLGKPGEGFRRTEGALADDEEWDTVMEEIHEARRRERRPKNPERTP
jgi:hypothetical protein